MEQASSSHVMTAWSGWLLREARRCPVDRRATQIVIVFAHALGKGESPSITLASVPAPWHAGRRRSGICRSEGASYAPNMAATRHATPGLGRPTPSWRPSRAGLLEAPDILGGLGE